jgi:pimeloyl-ACP methyl ester carboxylesterase
MFELLPNATFHGLSRCGHWAQHEHPAEFQRVVENFMADVVGA